MRKKIRDFLNSGTTALVIATVSSILAVVSSTINVIFLAVVLAIATAYLLFVGYDFLQQGTWRKSAMKYLVYEDVLHDWKVDENGDFHLKTIFKVKNEGASPISVIPEENGYWFAKPNNIEFGCAVVDQDKVHHAIVEYHNNLIETLKGFIGGTPNYLFSWKHTIEPTIMPGETVSLEVVINTQQTETAAFTREGTFAGIPANLPVRHAGLVYTGPKSHVFEVLPPVQVLDPDLKPDLPEAQRVALPTTKPDSNSLVWDLVDLHANKRYLFRYRLNEAH